MATKKQTTLRDVVNNLTITNSKKEVTTLTQKQLETLYSKLARIYSIVEDEIDFRDKANKEKPVTVEEAVSEVLEEEIEESVEEDVESAVEELDEA